MIRNPSCHRLLECALFTEFIAYLCMVLLHPRNNFTELSIIFIVVAENKVFNLINRINQGFFYSFKSSKQL